MKYRNWMRVILIVVVAFIVLLAVRLHSAAQIYGDEAERAATNAPKDDAARELGLLYDNRWPMR